jgi:peptide chain release factor 2
MRPSRSWASCERRRIICGGLFDVAAKQQKAADLEKRMEAPDFWGNPDKANEVVQELKQLNRSVKPFAELETQLGDIGAMLELAEEAGDDEMLGELDPMVDKLSGTVGQLEFQAMMTQEADPLNAFVTIQAGAGGTESCDWAMILYRMYLRWAEEKDYATEELDLGPGEVAGIRSVTFAVRGQYAYGYLRSETGVHRLVRISPFDANARRQTSFASVDVVPEIQDEINIEIKDGDIEMETFMSGGPGGQHQNKTASGVRLRHLPSGLAVECRNERSQHKNRATAMNMLKARLYRIEQEKREAELAKHHEGKADNSFGSQIRSYVLHPYQMVKDHRTDTEVGNAGGVLDGNLDPFMESYLRSQIGKNLA